MTQESSVRPSTIISPDTRPRASAFEYQISGLCRSSANRPRLRDLAARGRASAARLSALPHRLPLIFPTLRRTSFTNFRTHTANQMGESRVARKHHGASPAQFQAVAAQPDGFPHHHGVLREGFVAAFRTQADALQALVNASLNDLI